MATLAIPRRTMTKQTSNGYFGSTFNFTARLEIATSVVTRPANLDSAVLDGVPVLVVDDNATNRQILETTLSYWRMKPAAAAGSASALAGRGNVRSNACWEMITPPSSSPTRGGW